MHNGVQYVRDICKKRKISIRQLEIDCGFGNGYLDPKKIKKIPYERAVVIAEYLDISVDDILNGPDKKTPLINEDQELIEYLEVLKTRPEMRMLFQLSKDATKEDVEAAVRIIEALRKK